jgi:NAD(P)-dependent dehydrogenase (short-subunit alcohol dehydrogenase family)
LLSFFSYSVLLICVFTIAGIGNLLALLGVIFHFVYDVAFPPTHKHAHHYLPEAGSLIGKQVVITGATGDMGLDMAKAFAAAGANVFLVGKNAHRCQRARVAVIAYVERLEELAMDQARQEARRLSRQKAIQQAQRVERGLDEKPDILTDTRRDSTATTSQSLEQRTYDGNDDNDETDENDNGLKPGPSRRAAMAPMRHRVTALTLDLTDTDAVRQFPQDLGRKARGQIDVLIHNAGSIIHNNGGSTSDPTHALDTMYLTNFLGCFMLTGVLERHFNKHARVLFTNSSLMEYGNIRAVLDSSMVIPRMPQANEPTYDYVARAVQMATSGFGRNDRITDAQMFADTKKLQMALVKILSRRWHSRAGGCDLIHSVDELRPIYSRASAETCAKSIQVHAFDPGPVFSVASKMWPQWGRTTWLKEPTWFACAWYLWGFGKLDHHRRAVETALWLATTDDEHVRKHNGSFWSGKKRIRTGIDRGVVTAGMFEQLWRMWESHAGIKWTDMGWKLLPEGPPRRQVSFSDIISSIPSSR